MEPYVLDRRIPSGRVTLRAIGPDDLLDVHAYMGREDVATWLLEDAYSFDQSVTSIRRTPSEPGSSMTATSSCSPSSTTGASSAIWTSPPRACRRAWWKSAGACTPTTKVAVWQQTQPRVCWTLRSARWGHDAQSRASTRATTLRLHSASGSGCGMKPTTSRTCGSRATGRTPTYMRSSRSGTHVVAEVCKSCRSARCPSRTWVRDRHGAPVLSAVRTSTDWWNGRLPLPARADLRSSWSKAAMALNVDGEHHVFLEVEAGLIRSHRGDLEGAENCLRSARSRLPDNAPAWWIAAFMVRWLAAEIAAARGDHAAARTELTGLLSHEEGVRTSLGWRVLFLAARIEAGAAGTPSSIRQTGADEGRDQSAALPAPGHLGPAWAAQLAAESRRFAGSAQAADWEAAAEGLHRTGQVHDEAWARLRLAGCPRRLATRSALRKPSPRHWPWGHAWEPNLWFHAVHEVAGRGRIPLDAVDNTPISHRQFGLTQRELEVLCLVAEGYRNDQIAETLFISPKTASVHVSRILAKLGASTRTEATAVAHRQGLLDER